MPMIRMHRALRARIVDAELSRPFTWRFCSESDVVVNVETELDATKVLARTDSASDRLGSRRMEAATEAT